MIKKNSPSFAGTASSPSFAGESSKSM